MGDISNSDYEHCVEIVRQLDRDLYLADLFIAKQYRYKIMVLQVFHLTIFDVCNHVREPLPGEMRLQWWRDVIAGERDGEANSNPLSRALLQLVNNCDLPRAALQTMIDASVVSLYQDPMPDTHSFEAHAGETWGLVFQMSCQIIAGKPVREASDMCGHAGIVRSVELALRRLPLHRQKQQCFIPGDIRKHCNVSSDCFISNSDAAKTTKMITEFAGLGSAHLTKSRQVFSTLPDELKIVFLPLVLSGNWIERAKLFKDNLLTNVPVYPQWQRQIALWRAARRGRI